MSKKYTICSSVCLLVLLCSSNANAAGFIITPPSQLTGMANAGSAVYNKSTVVINTNPAAMSLIDSAQMGGNFTIIAPDWSIDEAWDCQAENNCADSNVAPVAFIPTFGIIKPMGNKFTWGLGIGALAGAGFDYGNNWKGRTIVTENGVQVLGITNSVSYKVNDQFNIGAGLGIIYGTFKQDLDLPTLTSTAGDDLVSLVTFVGLAQDCSGPPALIQTCRLAAVSLSGLNPASAAETVSHLASYLNGSEGTVVELEGDDYGAQIILGLTYDFTENHRLGLAYHYNSDLVFDGDAKIKGPLLSDLEYQKNSSSLSWDMPNRVIISGYHKASDRVDLYWDFERVFFDTFQRNDIRIDHYPTLSLTRNFKDANRFAVGMEYQYSDHYTLQMGISYDESPVDDEDRSPDIPVDEITKVAFGVRYQWSEQLEVHGFTNIELLGDSKIEQLAVLNGHKIGESVQMDSDATLYVLGVSFSYKF